MSRRNFLEKGVQTLSAAALAVPALSLISCSQEPLGPGSGAGQTINIPNSPSNVYTFNFSDYPQLQTPGGSIHVVVAATSGNQELFITRVSTSTAYAVSSKCTHVCCTLNAYDPSTQQYYCNCHGSIFNADGTVAHGPAKVNLPTYAGSITTTGIQLTITPVSNPVCTG
jgi:Rieske Fe-S protein